MESNLSEFDSSIHFQELKFKEGTLQYNVLQGELIFPASLKRTFKTFAGYGYSHREVPFLIPAHVHLRGERLRPTCVTL